MSSRIYENSAIQTLEKMQQLFLSPEKLDLLEDQAIDIMNRLKSESNSILYQHIYGTYWLLEDNLSQLQ